MAKKANQNGRSKERHVRLTHSMIDSAAYRSLSANARALLIELLRLYNSFNNGAIGLGCRQAGKLIGVNKDTAKSALDELADRGFIKCTRDSCFNMKSRVVRRWALTFWPLKPGIAPTNDWRWWTPQNSENGLATGTDSLLAVTDAKNLT